MIMLVIDGCVHNYTRHSFTSKVQINKDLDKLGSDKRGSTVMDFPMATIPTMNIHVATLYSHSLNGHLLTRYNSKEKNSNDSPL